MSIKFQNRKTVNNPDGNNPDIIQALLKAVPEAIQQGATLAPMFLRKTNDPKKIAELAWNFGKTKINYQIDDFGKQVMQLPSALLNSKNGDCKSLTLLMVSILANALPKIPLYIRFASYDATNPTPTHVYCYIILNGAEIIVDPVYFAFNKEKAYFYNQDFNVMEISTVAGFDDEIGKTRKQRQEKRKANKAKRKEKIKKKFGTVKKIGLAGPRGSFLLLVKINARGLAHKLQQAPSDKVKKIWNALGGNYDKLVDAVKVGAKKKAFLGERTNEVEGLEGIGSVVAVSTLLVSAAGVLAAISPILKSVEKSKGKKAGEPGTDEIEKETEDAGGDLKIPSGEVGDGEPGSGKGKGEGKGKDKDKDKDEDGFDFSLSNPIVLVGGAAAAYFLLKGK